MNIKKIGLGIFVIIVAALITGGLFCNGIV